MHFQNAHSCVPGTETGAAGISLSSAVMPDIIPDVCVLASDIDGTMAPEKSRLHQFPYDNSIPVLNQVLTEMKMAVWYLTARDLFGVREVISEYDLMLPDEYVATHAGARIYRALDRGADGVFHEVKDYQSWIEAQAPGWNRERFSRELCDLSGQGVMIRQADRWQAPFKLSYYTPEMHDFCDIRNLSVNIESRLRPICPSVVCTASQDSRDGYGLVDITPGCGDKAGAIEYLRSRLGILSREIVVAGDNRNDESALKGAYAVSIVPNNASPEFKSAMRSHALETGRPVIAARPDTFNANYSSGILEGLLEAGIIDYSMLPES